MKRTLKYTLSLLLLIQLFNPLCAQQKPVQQQPAQQKPGQPPPGQTPPAQQPEQPLKSRVRGPRIGYDLASLTLLYFEPDRKIYTFSVDYEAWQDIYPVLEFGYQNVVITRDSYRYGSSGIFARAGVDLNLLKYEKPNVYEMFYVGFRYGIGYMSHQAENIIIPPDYFDGLNNGYVVENQVNAHWVSVVGGIRAELFNNVFMGWSVLANIKLSQIEDVNMVPYNIPGFGKGDKKTSIIINYTIAYRFPLQRYTPKKILKKKSEEL